MSKFPDIVFAILGYISFLLNNKRNENQEKPSSVCFYSLFRTWDLFPKRCAQDKFTDRYCPVSKPWYRIWACSPMVAGYCRRNKCLDSQ